MPTVYQYKTIAYYSRLAFNVPSIYNYNYFLNLLNLFNIMIARFSAFALKKSLSTNNFTLQENHNVY